MVDSFPRQRPQQRAGPAGDSASREAIERSLAATANDVLLALARNPGLLDRDLLRLLERKDLSSEIVQELAKHPEAQGNYRVLLALACHPKTPRTVSLRVLKFLYLFDLLRVAQTAAVPRDVRVAAEEAILKKLEGMPRGEKLSLAKRGTGRLAAQLLISEDPEMVRAALQNPYLTEAHLLKVLAHDDLPATVVELVAGHARWSHCYHLRLALIRNPLTPLAKVLTFLPEMAVPDLRDICLDRRMPGSVRKYVLAHCRARLSGTR